MLTVRELKEDVPGHLAAATEHTPVLIRRYNDPYRMVLPYEQGVRALAALQEKEQREQEAVA